MEQLTLFHYWRSSCSWRVRWCLYLKGIPFVSKTVNILAGEHKQREYLQLNPAGYLPTLKINNQFYGESLAILNWLEDEYPQPSIYPKDRLLKLRANQIALTIATGIQPLQNPSALAYFEANPASRHKHAQHFITRGLSLVESLIHDTGHHDFSVSNEVTIADLCLIPQVYNAKRFDIDLTSYPNISRVYANAMLTEACQKASPEHQPDAIQA